MGLAVAPRDRAPRLTIASSVLMPRYYINLAWNQILSESKERRDISTIS